MDESDQDIAYVHGECEDGYVCIIPVDIHYRIRVIFVCHLVFQIFFVLLYYKTFNCIITFVVI